jgi:hypothetical protein
MDIKTKFSIEIEKYKALSPDVSFIEIIVEYCEKNEIDLTNVPKFLSPSLKQKIARESSERNLIENFSEYYAMDNYL